MHQNLATPAMITVSSEKIGTIGAAVKFGTGSGTVEPSGSYVGEGDLLYTLEIDSVAMGAEVGQATFRWRDGSTSTWDGSGILTATTPVTLNNGISARFVSGTGADFVRGDQWRFLALKRHGRAKLVDFDRNTEFRTAQIDSPSWMKIGLPTPQRVRCLILGDHNLTSGATITLQANSSDEWDTPAYSATITWAEDTLCVFMDQTFQWWRLVAVDAGNPDSYIRASELFFGDYLEFNWLSPVMPAAKISEWFELSSISDVGVERVQALNVRRQWPLRLVFHNSAEVTQLASLFRALRDYQGQRTYPCWFTPRASVPAETYLVYPGASFTEKIWTGDNREETIECREAVRACIA
jgi:hypothetical protein